MLSWNYPRSRNPTRNARYRILFLAMNPNRFQTLVSRLSLLASLFLLAAAIPACAQRLRGELHLEIRDPKGSSLPAKGELLSEGNGFERRFQIPTDGHLVLQDLPFGIYRLNLTAEGFAAWSDVVEVHSEVPVKLGITLGVAPVTTQVQVTDELTLVDPTRTGTLYSVGKQSIHEQLSLQPGRDLFDLVNQEPGWVYEGNGVLHPRGSEYDVQFVVDGQPLVQNRSPAFAPDMDSDSVESLRLLTASYPAEYGRQLDGSAAISWSREKERYSVRAFGLHSGRYLDPPVTANFGNDGNSGGFSAAYERDFSYNDRLRLTIAHNSLRYEIPNDFIQQIALQRQDAASSETNGQIYYQHTIPANLLLSFSGAVRDSSFSLRSNPASTPVIVNQDRGYREGYVRGDIAGHRGHHDWKAGADSFFTPVNEALQYQITDTSQFDPGTQLNLNFAGSKWDIEPSFYVQDQMRYGGWKLL